MTALDFLLFAQQQIGRPVGPGGFPAGGGGVPSGAAAGGAGAAIGLLICYFVFVFVMIAFFVAVQWKIFSKAGEPGWAAIVPVYNVMILSKICGRGEMFGLLCLVPCVNIVVGIMLTLDLAKVFGKDMGFAIGMLLLPIVFMPILAFGSAEYVGASGGGRSRRRRDYDEDEDEDDRPRRRRRDDDDDDRPRRRPRRDDY
jgi:hypothetical protein